MKGRCTSWELQGYKQVSERENLAGWREAARARRSPHRPPLKLPAWHPPITAQLNNLKTTLELMYHSRHVTEVNCSITSGSSDTSSSPTPSTWMSSPMESSTARTQ
ncbi:hypothetical protein E2C01_078763 [Portunus trituberculatus]|uniref:Uncharacterized protein n=1 Tax=Portunus trituberculatus TaxID=210409 RepID=A0A5B7IR34_PORTR|nr:hypothetical protein [Portunus trituberculatus]